MPKPPRRNPPSSTASAAASASTAAASTAASIAADSTASMAADLDTPETLTSTTQDPTPPLQNPQTTPPAEVPEIPAVAVAEAPAVAVPTVPESPEVPAIPTRKTGKHGRRKKSQTSKKAAAAKEKLAAVTEKLAAIEEKLAFLRLNLRAVPFSPGPTPDLVRHERLFRALGLYEFVHLNLAADPLRPDLISQLIASYSPHTSKVCDVKIRVSRLSLAEALSLPYKKGPAPAEDDLPLYAGDDAVKVLSDFIGEWMVVMEHGCVFPDGAGDVNELVMKGEAYKVDWAGMVWTLVEKELQEVPRTGECHYAAYLQRLIKHQKPELFESVMDSQPEMTVEVVSDAEEDTDNVALVEEEIGADNLVVEDFQDGDVSATGLGEFQEVGLDDNGPQLSLGLGSEVDVMLGLDDCDGGAEPSWFTDGKEGGDSHFLQRCSMNNITDMECDAFDNGGEDKAGREEPSFGGEFEVKFSGLDRLNSTDLLHAVTDANGSYNMQQHPLDPSSCDFLSTGNETHKNMEPDSVLASPFSFGNSSKRHIDEIDDGEVHPFNQLNPQKRIRTEGQWEGHPSTHCYDQVEYWMGKAKLVQVETEQAYNNSQMELQYTSDMLAQREQMIQSLEKARVDAVEKREAEARVFEHELLLMTRVVSGYKRALMETRNAFAEYRKKFPQDDEPYYKDVERSGGLVISTGESEKLQLLKEQEEILHAAELKRLEKEESLRVAEVKRLENAEEKRHFTEMIHDFAKEWHLKFTEFENTIANLATKLMRHTEDVKCLKDSSAKQEVSETKAMEE